MKLKKSSVDDVGAWPAPNRHIRELFSGRTLGAQGVTFRVVDMLPASRQEPRRPHSHPDFEEVIFILSGQGRIWAEGEWLEVRAGDAVLVPPGVVHATFNTTEETLRLASFFPVAEGVDQRTRAAQYVTLDLEPGNA